MAELYKGGAGETKRQRDEETSARSGGVLCLTSDFGCASSTTVVSTWSAVTNSYQGMVWATWLGRRVVYRPWSSKFAHWRYPASRWAENEPLEAAIGRAVVYPHALEESREANRAFAREVSALIEQAQSRQ